MRRKRRADGSIAVYHYHKGARQRLYGVPGTKAFEAEYDRADRGAATSRRGGRAKPTWVYFIRAAETQHVKIGKASAPKKRLSMLQIGSPLALSLAATVYDPSGGELERELHRRFASLKVRAEWFRASPELEAYIADCATVGISEFVRP